MKRLLSLFLIIGLCLTTISGCSKKKTIEKFSTTYATEVKTLDPYLLLDTTAMRVTANTQDSLVENDKYGKFIPSLAESWSHNEDFTVWTFKLRKGVKWIDYQGKETNYEVTADDFVEGMKFISDPKNGIKNVGIITKEIKGLNNYYYDLSDIDSGDKKDMTREEVLKNFDKNVGVKAVDNNTVEYTLTHPVPYFLSYLVTELFFPVEKTFLGQVGEENYGTSKEKILYNGAYYISDWQRDKAITLTQNSSYWDKNNVTVKQVSLQKVSDDSINAQMFQRGELTAATLQADQVKALQGTKWEDNVNLREKSSVTYWFYMNYTSANPEFKPFVNNLNFRKALYYGIDREKLQQLYNPYNPKAMLRNTIIPEEVIYDDKGVDYTDYPGLKEIKEANPYNPKLAKEYIEKAIAELVGPDGNIKGVEAQTIDMLPIAKFKIDGKLPVQILFPHSTDSTDTKLAQLLAEMLKVNLGENNVELVLGQYVDDKFNDTIEPRKFDLGYDSFSFKYADPMAQLGRLITDGSINDGQYSDPVFDKMVSDAAKITVIDKRHEAFAKAEKYMIDNVYVIPYAAGGGSYELSKAIPFTTPRGGFGITRFKYKGMAVVKDPITKQEYANYEKQFNEDLKKANTAK